MQRRYLAFDIETSKVGVERERDWRAHRPLGISCAATLVWNACSPVLWYGANQGPEPARRMSQHEVQVLVSYLMKKVSTGYTILTWNGLGFDFDILAEESGMIEQCRDLATNHVDMMFHIVCQLGYGVGLDSAAKGMKLRTKSPAMNGALAPQMWLKHKHKAVLDHVAQDARVTLDLARTSEERGFLRWITRRGVGHEIPLPLGWLVVSVARRLPIPNTSWMTMAWHRARFTGWLG